MDRRPDCDGSARPLTQPPRKLQQVDLPDLPVEAVEYRMEVTRGRDYY